VEIETSLGFFYSLPGAEWSVKLGQRSRVGYHSSPELLQRLLFLDLGRGLNPSVSKAIKIFTQL
jgi:hypothetical protein